MTLWLLASGCAATAREDAGVCNWGTIREVLREGRSEGRVELARALGPSSVAVGALADLAGEITVDRGALHLVEVVAAAPDGVRAFREECACESRVLARPGESTESIETRRGTRIEVQGSSFRAELIGESTAGGYAPEQALRLATRSSRAHVVRAVVGARRADAQLGSDAKGSRAHPSRPDDRHARAAEADRDARDLDAALRQHAGAVALGGRADV